MTRDDLKTSHYTTYNDIYAVWLSRTVKDIADFEDVLDGFIGYSCWHKFKFDATYTRERMVSDWRAFLSGIMWCMES